jgi:hypothetical protein
MSNGGQVLYLQMSWSTDLGPSLSTGREFCRGGLTGLSGSALIPRCSRTSSRPWTAGAVADHEVRAVGERLGGAARNGQDVATFSRASRVVMSALLLEPASTMITASRGPR